MKPQAHLQLNRRNFLKMMGAAGAAAVGGQVLYMYSPWLNTETQAAPKNRALDDRVSHPMVELVRSAVLAANGHNTQPWKFAVSSSAVDIHPDPSRRLPVVDPEDRELWMSLGCALENLLISARAAGFEPEITYPDAADWIHVGLKPGPKQSSALFDAIPLRQNTRSQYDGQPVSPSDLSQLQALGLEPGVALHWAASPDELEKVAEYVNLGDLAQYAEQAFVEELIHWLRFNRGEQLRSLDGLFSACSGNPEVPRWLGKWFVSGTVPQQQADADVKKLRSSAGAVIITSDSDNRSAWVRTGQVYQRLALMMTSLNIKSALLNQPIEVPSLRGQFQSALGLESALPQLLVRYGYAEAMPRSIRRPLDQVLL